MENNQSVEVIIENNFDISFDCNISNRSIRFYFFITIVFVFVVLVLFYLFSTDGNEIALISSDKSIVATASTTSELTSDSPTTQFEPTTTDVDGIRNPI